jgi:hypothetical protein
VRLILKFPLVPGTTEITTSDEPTFLAVGWQRDHLVAWVEATPGVGVVTAVAATPTGSAPPDEAVYVGTAQHPTLLGGAPLVMHVYRQAGR